MRFYSLDSAITAITDRARPYFGPCPTVDISLFDRDGRAVVTLKGRRWTPHGGRALTPQKADLIEFDGAIYWDGELYS